MKIQQYSPHFVPSINGQRGFALIATISVMVLLVMVALAMMSLSVIELRGASNSRHQQEAKANARMALMIAIGELQKYAGPDQRISARADIKVDCDPSKKYWTGIWNTGGWDTMHPSQRDFENWLVSSPAGRLNEDDVAQPLSGDRLVTLVGTGSVLDFEGVVKVSKVNVIKDGKPSGAYAYWVGDEGVKASYHVPTLSDDDWNSAGNLGTTATSGISALKWAGYDKLDESKLYGGGVSRKSLDLLLESKELSRQFFHDVTPQAISLLTDVRLGGSRRDLSTAFELPLEEFNAITEFHAADEQNDTDYYDKLSSAYAEARFYHQDSSPDLGYVCEIPWQSGMIRGASWDLLRNHYRLYKKEWENDTWARSIPGVGKSSFAARGSLPHSYSGEKPGWGNYASTDFAYHISNGALYSKASFGRFAEFQSLSLPRGGLAEKRTVKRSPKLTPFVARVSIAIGMVKRSLNNGADWSLALSFDPYVTIVNPYNVPITFTSIGIMSQKFNPFRVVMEYTDQAGKRQKVKYRKFFSANWGSNGTFYVKLNPKNGPFTLEPGEVRVISPSKIQSNIGQLAARSGISMIKGGFHYTEDSGFYMAQDKSVQPKENTTVVVTLKGKEANWGATERILVSLYHNKDHNGGNRDIYKHLQPSEIQGDEDILDQPLIANIGFNTTDGKSQTNLFVKRSIGTSQIPQPGQSGLYVGVLDIKLNTMNESFPSLTLNPRAGAFDTRDYDGMERSSPQWKVEVKSIDDLSQLELVVDPSGHGLWGEGRTSANGSTHTVLYEIPQVPLSSLAQLQHVNTGNTGSSGSLQIGNSFPHPGIKDLNSIVNQRKTVMGGYSSVQSQVLSDMSWGSNDVLWDRFFFSGLNWGDANSAGMGVHQKYLTHQKAIDALIEGDRESSWPLQNPRMDLFSRSLSDAQKDELLNYDKLAKYLAIFGGFNVNSTSPKAWQAVFSSLRNVDVEYLKSGSGKISSKSKNAFSRFIVPTAKSGATFGSFHNISDNDIETLAEKMVEQVKARGPFMGLGDFVNRRLTTASQSGTDLGACGALQAAIEAAGLNDGKMSHKPTAQNLENVTYQVGGKTRTISTYAGTAGYLLQADILGSIGGILTARSDTFLIRAYGEARDPKGRVLSRAWCEATVQRTPEWLENTDESATRKSASYPSVNGTPLIRQWETNPDFPKVNQTMGRQFTIKSFRWLSSREV